jgi:hypothetical protein
MNNKIALGLGVFLVGMLGLVAVQRTAHAGANLNATISITGTTTGTASGALGVVRSGSDASGMISCSVHENGPSGTYWGCYAQNANGSASCAIDMVTDPQYQNAFIFMTALINSDSFIKFSWKTVNGSRVCTVIRVETDSRYAKKI